MWSRQMIDLKTSIRHSERQAWIAVSTSSVLMVVVEEARGEIGLRSLVRKMASKRTWLLGKCKGPQQVGRVEEAALVR